MLKERKPSIIRGNSSKIVDIPWRTESLAITFNDNTLRTCDVVLMVESDETCSDFIHSCYMGYKLNPVASVKILNYRDLKIEAIEYVNNKDRAENDKLLEKAYAEAVSDMQTIKTISSELLAHIIKLKINQIILEDIKMEQEKLFLEMEKEKEYKKLFESSADGNGTKTKKAKGKPTKEVKKVQEKSKKKTNTSTEDSKISTNPPKPFSQFYKNVEHPDIQVEEKHLYVVLSGFYTTELIRQLIDIGVPLVCLLEVSFLSQSILFNENNNEDIVSEGDFYSQRRRRSTEQSEAGNFIESTPILESHLGPFKTFWIEVINKMHSTQQQDYLKDIFHMFYKVKEHLTTVSATKSEELCNTVFEKHFEDLSNHIKEIETVKRKYTNYIRNLKLQEIPYTPIMLPLHCLRVYNKLINKFPPDCFSIALLIACLLEEVCSRVPEVPQHLNSLILSKETKENPFDEANNTETNSATENHGDIRDQVVGVLESYKKRHVPSQYNKNNAKQIFRCYTCKYDPKIDLKIDFKCFMVHANNDLQLLMNCYKKLSKELYAINISGLKKSKAAIIRSRHAVGIVLEKLMNEYNLQSWRKALGLTKDELCDAIHIFLLEKLKNKYKQQTSNAEISETQLYPCMTYDMLSRNCSIRTDSTMNMTSGSEYILQGQMSLGILYRNFSKNVSQILYPASLNDYCYKEYLPGPVLLQELLKASLEYNYVEHLYSPLTDTVLLLFHNNLNEFGCASMFKKEFLRTPVCLRDFCQHILQVENVWIEDQEFFYQTDFKQQVKELKQKKEELRNALYSEFIPDEYYFILPDSIKAKLIQKNETQSNDKETKSRKESKDEQNDKKSKKKEKESLPSKKSEEQLDIEDVLKQMPEMPPKKTLSLRCAKENEPYTFIAYNLSNSQVQINAWTSIFQSLDGLKVSVNKDCWLGGQTILSVKLTHSNHNFIFHYCPDLVTTEPFTFHSILADGCCLAFSKPIKLKSVEDVICERICSSKKNIKLQHSDDSSAYEKKPQEIYFVSEKQDCVIKSLKVPFSTERNLVLSEKLLVPFLDSLEKFNIRAHITVPSETLRQRQKRRHNLRNRTSNSAVTTKTALSKFATKKRKKSLSPENVTATEQYSSKIIVHKPPNLNSEKIDNENFLQHSVDSQKIRALPQASKIHKQTEALKKLKEAIEKHIPVFKICSSRLHKFTYVKRIKSYVNISVGNATKRILYKPSYYKSKRTIEIKKCLPLGCVNVTKTKKPAYSIRVSLPSGLMIRDIPGVTSEFPCIRQYYIDRGPQCKDIVHEESRTFLRNGNIAIKRCDGNINVLSANGRIFHFEIPYIMKTRTERLNYRDANVTKLQKHRPPGVPIHAARKSLTTFQKLLHKVLPRRFKHMIDSKESRYYLSRRAYLRAQKKYCTNINALYLLESQRQPFPEYTVITPDGKKIKVSNSKVYEEHKFYVATDIDFRTEETLYEREDGTCCILNREGVLTTQFPDGTRLTTWFVESPSQVFADEILTDSQIKDEATMFDNIDEDCNRSRAHTVVDFSVVLNQGFVSIFMYYEYSHPNYATVIFGGEDNEMKVVLPNGCAISSKEGQKTNVTIGKYLETEFDKNKFTMKARGCDNCVSSARAVVDLKTWYYGKLPKCKKDTFLYVKDSLDKHFRVDYNGICTRNPIESTKAEAECMRHTLPTLEKLFSVKSDFSGCVFWNKADFKAKMDFAERSENCTIDTYNDNAVVEFKTYISKPYHERYICKYEEPTLKLTKYKTKQGKLSANPAYILQNVLHRVVSIEKVEPLYKSIWENCKKYGLKKECETFEQFFTHLTQDLPMMHKIPKQEDQECLDPCPCHTKKEKPAVKVEEKDEMKHIQAQHDKWYKWQQECKKYKQLVKDNYVPLYFKSKYGYEFSDENRKSSDQTARIFNKELKETAETKTKKDDAEIHSKKFSSEMIVAKKDDIVVEKSKSVEKKPGKQQNKGKKIIKEQLRITIPKDMVLLYNSGKGDKKLEITEKKITAQTESTGNEIEDCTEKMLILANMRDTSKVEIANKFLEIHGKTKTFDAGSKVVVVTEETKPQTDKLNKNFEPKLENNKERKKKDYKDGTTNTQIVKEDSTNQTTQENVHNSPDVTTSSPKSAEPVKNKEPTINSVASADHKKQQQSQQTHKIQETVKKSPPSAIILKSEATNTVNQLNEDQTIKANLEVHKSATDILKDIATISKDLLATTTDVQTNDSVEVTKEKVMSLLSSLLNMIIKQLSVCPEEITQEVSSSITASAYDFICGASLNKKEMEFFLKALNYMVEEAINDVESYDSTSTEDSFSDIDLVNKSKLIPVKGIGDVLSSYNRDKQGLKINITNCIPKPTVDSDVKTASSVNEMYVNRINSIGPIRSTKVISEYVENVDEDSDFYISESLLRSASKLSSQHGDSVNAVKKKKSPSAVASRVKFGKASTAVSATSLQMLHESKLLSLTSVNDRVPMSSFHKKTPTPSMLPLYSSSIRMRHLDSAFDSDVSVFNDNGEVEKKAVLPEGRIVVSEGTQTYKGTDVNIQTSDELLAEK